MSGSNATDWIGVLADGSRIPDGMAGDPGSASLHIGLAASSSLMPPSNGTFRTTNIESAERAAEGGAKEVGCRAASNGTPQRPLRRAHAVRPVAAGSPLARSGATNALQAGRRDQAMYTRLLTKWPACFDRRVMSQLHRVLPDPA